MRIDKFSFLVHVIVNLKAAKFRNLVNSNIESEWFGIGKAICLEILI